MLNLNTDIRYIKGIGEAKGKAFARLGVRCVGDLLSDFPRAYEDRSKVLPIARLMEGEAACVCAMITTEPELSRIRKGMELLRFRIADASGSMLVTYFNQAWMKNRLRRGDTYIFYGKVQVTGRTFAFTNPIFEPEAEMGRVTGRIMPVYRLTGGISQRDMTQAVRRVLGEPGMTFPNALPERVERENRLCTARYAYENIHFPADMRALSLSRRRLVFEELFTLVCALSLVRGEGEVQPGIAVQPRDIAEFTATLPFTPTGAQLRAIADAAGDMTSGRLMNRLIQGDVGSGKTLVAAALIWLAAGSGLQSAFMAPTELLAEQHFATLSGFLAPFGLKVVKLTGSMGAKAKRETLAALDCRKQLLAARRAVIDAALSRALEAACAFPEARYLAVLERPLTQYAGEGDGVRLSASAPVTEESLQSLKVFSARRLRFLGKDGDFEGGMRLYGTTYEADLSFRALIEAQRFELERDIAHMMPAEK